MDVFIEKLVKKNNDGKALAINFLIVIATFILSIIAFVFLASFSLLFVAGLCYGAWYLLKMQQIEYEYSLTNGELDVDIIRGMSKRKHLFTVNCKDFEILAPFNETHKREFETPSITKKIYVCSSLKEADLYFAIFVNKEHQKVLLVFEPDERMLQSFKTYIGRKIIGN